jgi:hypothetical protein
MMQELSLAQKGLVDIHSLLRQLQQLIEQAEWDEAPSEHLKAERETVLKYHMQTGSYYYPLF